MRIVSNPGVNMSAAEIARYQIAMLPQHIVVDGKDQDTNASALTQSMVDEWIRTAKDYPYVVGSSAAELVDMFRKVAQKDREILTIMGSRHLIGSYASAVSAARTFGQIPSHAGIRIEVIDTELTDLGTGLCAIFAGEAIRAGLPFERVARLTERFGQGSHVIFAPRVLDNLIRGGRASFLKATMANLLGLSPILGLDKGQIRQFGTAKRDELISSIAKTLIERLAGKTRVWLGVIHGGDETGARELATELRRRLNVEMCIIRPASAAIYLHTGPRSIGAFAGPLDGLDWCPPPPAAAL